MKRSLIFILFIFFAGPCPAQWRNIGLGNPNGGDLSDSTIAMGTMDTSVFVSVVPLNNVGPLIWRITPSLSGWTPADTGIGRSEGHVTNLVGLGASVFAGIPDGLIHRSTDNGSSWPVIDSIGSPIATNGVYLFALDAKGISISKDGGTGWLSLNDNLSPYIYAAEGPCVLAVTSNGTYRSTDTGMNWTIIPTPPTGLSLSVFATVNSQMFAGDTGLFRSTDSGLHWTQFGLKNRIVSALVSYKTYLFAGTDSGIFISSDSGMNWRDVSDNMGAAPTRFPNVKLLALLDTMLFASVEAGVNPNNGWDYGYTTDRPISEMTSTSGVVQTELPGDTIEIYPNPSTGMLSIRSGGTSILGVRVLNVLGTDVLDIPKVKVPDLSFDLSKLPSGTYFLEIETAKGIAVCTIVKE